MRTGPRGSRYVVILLFSAILAFLSTRAGAEIVSAVTYGSSFTIKASDIGGIAFYSKPKVEITGDSLGSRFVALQVLTTSFPATQIECLFGVKAGAGTYSLYVTPGGTRVRKLAAAYFYVMVPALTGTDPQWGKPGQTVTVYGQYFGVSRPELWMEFFDPSSGKLKRLDCDVSKNVMDPRTGSSSVCFTVPAKMAQVVPILHLKSAAGEGQIVFCSFTFKKVLDVETPMRDGTILRGNLYTPLDSGHCPVLIFRTPYSKDEGDPYNERTFRNAVKRGYAVLVQDVRGRYSSEGDFAPYVNEGNDGYDTIEWAAAQPWSNGSVGTFGLSYPGAVQWLAAIQNPPHLKAMVPAMCFSTLRQFIYFGGIFEIDWTGWSYKYMSPDIRVRKAIAGPTTIVDATREYQDLGGVEAFQGWLPTLSMPFMKDTCDFYYDWLSHQPYDAYWDYGEIRQHYSQVKAAVLNLSGWYDEAYGTEGATTNFLGLLASRVTDSDKRTKLLIGPWTHGVDATETPQAGDRSFSDAARIDYDSTVLDWLDCYVKGEQNHVPDWPMVKVYRMGSEQWVSDSSWPLSGTREKPFYLIPEKQGRKIGSLSVSQPSTSYAPSAFSADPLNPVPDLLGTNYGAQNISYLSKRSDVLTFDSPPLQKDLVVAGQIKARIYLSSDSPDCDLFVKIQDVSPDGVAFNLMSPGQEAMRVSYRNQTAERQLLQPGRIVSLDFENMRTGNTFKKGHRIRVSICASWYPIYSRNLQTGELETTSSKTRIATINIHSDPAHASRVILPVQ
ncbi:MAG: CocE/NonD family hydrolase [Syntrophobacteraceae bacterium]|nr:CocE/NonD family hydrolase [Syntrophobacteraceae bacterium]